MIFFADFETTTTNTEYFKKNGDVRVWLWYIKSIDEKIDKMGVNIKDFISFIMKLQDKDIIYFHNLFFDGDYVVKELVNNWNWKIINEGDKVIDKTIKVFRRNKTIYYINLYTNKKSITLKCSFQILMSSIKDLGKSVNIKKLVDEINENYDFEPVETLDEIPQKYKDYIINDVRIALNAYKNFKSLIKNINPKIDLTKQITIGGLTRNLMKNEENSQYLYIDNLSNSLANKLYRGGFTQYNPEFQQIDNKVNDLRIIDVNSAYPYFLSQNLPYNAKECNCNTLNDYQIYHLVNVKGKIKQKYKNIWIFPNPKNDLEYSGNRYVGDFEVDELWVFSKELKYYNEFYDMSYNINKKYCCDNKPFLNEYMVTLFEYKKQFKKEENIGFLKPIKILLNSVYGSLCLKSNYDNFLYFNRENFTPFFTKKVKVGKYNKVSTSNYVIKGQSFNYNFGEYHCFRYEEIAPEIKHCNKLAAAWVTSMQRCKLYETISNLSNPNFQWMYADTDSLFLKDLTKKDNEYIDSLISEELGDWDIENKDDKKGTVSIVGAKRYEVTVGEFRKQKLSGVKRSINFRFFLHDNLIRNACLRPLYCKSGIALEEVDKEIIWGKQ